MKSAPNAIREGMAGRPVSSLRFCMYTFSMYFHGMIAANRTSGCPYAVCRQMAGKILLWSVVPDPPGNTSPSTPIFPACFRKPLVLVPLYYTILLNILDAFLSFISVLYLLSLIFAACFRLFSKPYLCV